jgi:hypothetical protein
VSHRGPGYLVFAWRSIAGCCDWFLGQAAAKQRRGRQTGTPGARSQGTRGAWALAAQGLHAVFWPGESGRAQRKPTLSLRLSGVFLLRLAARTLFAELFHEPPRKTRPPGPPHNGAEAPVMPEARSPANHRAACRSRSVMRRHTHIVLGWSACVHGSNACKGAACQALSRHPTAPDACASMCA